jgi:hypothetical protein
MFKRKLIIAGILSAAALPGIVLAEDPPKAEAAKPALPSMDDLLNAWGISVTGYLDGSYTHANRQLVNGVLTGRSFDQQTSAFNLDQAAITIAKQPKEGFGGVVNVIAGQDAKLIHSNGLGAADNPVDLTQAYLQYATGPFTIIGGKFVTLAGYEVIASPSNVNFSRSILFGQVPLTHTGVRGTWAVNDMVTLTLGLNNGWDQTVDQNKQKTIEAAVAVTPIKGLTITAIDYYGHEPATAGLVTTTPLPDNPSGKRNLFDLVASYSPIDPLTLGLEYMNESQDNFTDMGTGNLIKAKSQGVAGYVSYMFTEQWRLAFRAEYFKDNDGFRLGFDDTKYKEGTLTLAYLPTKSIELRAEARYDKASPPSTITGVWKNSDGTFSNSLTTVALQAIYKF